MEFETKATEFHGFIAGILRKSKYSLSQIDKSDGTAVFSICLANMQ
jgi:hypothetical protein